MLLQLLLYATRILFVLHWRHYCFYKKENCYYRRKLVKEENYQLV